MELYGAVWKRFLGDDDHIHSIVGTATKADTDDSIALTTSTSRRRSACCLSEPATGEGDRLSPQSDEISRKARNNCISPVSRASPLSRPRPADVNDLRCLTRTKTERRWLQEVIESED